MKKIKLHLILISFAYLFPMIFSSCSLIFGGCDGTPPSQRYFRTTGLNGKVYVDNSVYTNQVLNSSTFIEVRSVVELYGYQKNDNHFSSGMLYACSPIVLPIYGKEKVKKISVTSNKSFSNTLSIGNDLSSVFRISYRVNYDYNSGLTFSFDNTMNLVDYPLTTQNQIPAYFHLSFLEFPTTDKNHIFTIKYEQEDGVIYTYTTPEMIFP